MANGNAKAQADRIFKQIDLDDNGSIEFEEWCRATMNKRKILSQKRLLTAYNFLDDDGNGKVDFDEIRAMFKNKGYEFTDETFLQFIKEVDLDGDGSISFEEFENMMQLLVNNKMLTSL